MSSEHVSDLEMEVGLQEDTYKLQTKSSAGGEMALLSVKEKCLENSTISEACEQLSDHTVKESPF